MIKHIVMYKLKDASRDNCDEMVRRFLSMSGKIEQLKSVKAGVDILRSPRSYDVVLECEFESREDMNAYQQHPVHIPVKQFVGELIECAHSVDYEC